MAVRVRLRKSTTRRSAGTSRLTARAVRQVMLTTDPERSAAAAGLRYVEVRSPGIRRVRAGKGFRYLDPKGRPIRRKAVLERIRALVIPPAWTEVWICPDPRGHIQAVGLDDRGRKQYRYHARWRVVRDETKYGRLIAFARALPRTRARVARDLELPGLPREKVLAAVVRLLEMTLIRIGNDEYAQENKSYGLTTLRDPHADVAGSAVEFRFRGKSGVKHTISIEDPQLAKIIRRCQDLPGQELFQYLDDAGEPQDIGSEDVNAYLQAITGAEFTAKDFRTWGGTVLAFCALAGCNECETKRQAKQAVVQVVDQVAERLGNTRAVCRKCYVHPAVFETYLDGLFGRLAARCARKKRGRAFRGLTRAESTVLQFLEACAKVTQSSRKSGT